METLQKKIEIRCENQNYAFNIIDGLVNMDINDPDMNITSYIHDVFSKRGIKTNGVFIKAVPGYAEKSLEDLDKLREEEDELTGKLL